MEPYFMEFLQQERICNSACYKQGGARLLEYNLHMHAWEMCRLKKYVLATA